MLTYPITHGSKTVINAVAVVMNAELEGTRFEGPIAAQQDDTTEMRSMIRQNMDKDRQVLFDV
jgi:hypothetical protein